MKKIILAFVIVLGISQFAKAQTDLGVGVLIGTGETAIEAKANFYVSDVISISPFVDYYLVGGDYDYSLFLAGVDGHYNFEVGDGFVVYPLVGLNYFYVTGDGYSGGSDIGLTIGGGATYGLSDSMKLYAEAKYIRTGFGLAAGILFSL